MPLNFCLSQNSDSKEKYYKYYDLFMAYENKNIFNGLEYTDEYPSISTNSHKFYQQFDFYNTTIIYDGQPYFDIKAKYHLLDDILLIEYVNNKINYLKLNSNMISQFMLNNRSFVKLNNTKALKPFYKNGFFEVSYQDDNYSLYTKRIKNKIKRIQNEKLYYVFTEEKVFILAFKNQFFRIRSKNDLKRSMPDKNIYIEAFYNLNKNLYSNNRLQFVIKFLRNLNK